MAKYIIEGGNRLKGEIKISGNKNSVLPCLAATLLTSEQVTLTNVPQIADVAVFLEILRTLGAEVIETGEDTVKITASKITTSELPVELVSKLRASVLLVGPLLSRTKKVKFSHPGGDIIGRRSINTHLLGFSQLGYEFTVNDRNYEGKLKHSIKDDKNIFLGEPSVTATENLILTSVLGSSKVTLMDSAQEPHVVDLCNLLNLMGANISGVGTSTIVITPVEKLTGAEFRIGPDFIELGTYAVAQAITGGQITLTNVKLEGLESIVYWFLQAGIALKDEGEKVKIEIKDLKQVPNLTVRPWPGFPTDLMSVMIVLATQTPGVSLLHDWMYESRMFFVDKLIGMGAHITIADPHRVFVYGPSKLFGRDVESPDIRAGMALVLAALIAKGTSVINKAELIERGYGDVVGTLTSLGAKIERVDS